MHTITGSAGNANTIYSQTSTFTGLGTESITLSDTTLAASVLNTLNGNTTGNINADTVSSFTGSISDLNTMFAAKASSGDGISFSSNSGAADQTVTISDTTDVSVTALTTLNGHTTGNIDASGVTSLASASISDIKTLLTAGNNHTNNFTSTSFNDLATVVVSDTSVSVADLNDSITQANTATTDPTTTVFSVSSGATITTGDEAAFTTLLTNEDNGNIVITDQNLTVSSGTISVDNANALNDTTTGTVTASIATEETVDELKTLSGTGAYTIVINSRDADAKQSTAAEFNTINSATTVAIDASNVVEIASSNLSDVKTLLTAGNDTDQFTANSFSSLDDVAIADATVDVSDFNAAVTQANTATGKTTAANSGGATVFTLANAATYSGGTAADFATLITNEGKELISGGITDEALTVDSGTIAVSAVTVSYTHLTLPTNDQV